MPSEAFSQPQPARLLTPCNTVADMATLLLFASAREAAGTGRVEVEGATVGEVLDAAVERFGPELAHVLAHSKVWLNGDPASREQPVPPGAEVAILPPVSGG